MKSFSSLFILLVCLLSVSAMAQKRVPYSFRYQSETSGRAMSGRETSDRETSGRETSGRDQLRFLTQVTQPGTTFLRLYFAGTQLGETSYLVLESADGNRQELRQPDLENWHYSSAYFNGSSVKVSLFAAAGERNTVSIPEIKITDERAERARNARQAAGGFGNASRTGASTSASITELYPYAKAVGRFTNGIDSYGTGWIAPNGAIVTSWNMYDLYHSADPYDVIEFNVPPSVGGAVTHPSPQDQYPLEDRNLPRSNYLEFKAEPYYTPFVNLYGWVIFEALPNGTGLRPGERQQEYFRIGLNPGNSAIDAEGSGNLPVNIFHYGYTIDLQGDPTFRTLQVLQTPLLKQNDFLDNSNDNRDRFVLYNTPRFKGSDEGAPITLVGSNVAIGVHNRAAPDEPGFTGYGLGFRDAAFRNEVSDFYASNSVYVDFGGPANGATGEIHKPYLFASQAASGAPSGAQVYFARGTYPGAATFNRPMTLRAPVGTVRIGASQVGGRQAAGPTIAPHWLTDESSALLREEMASEESRQVRAYPNPFREQTEIKYPFAEGGPVTVDIFNTAGVRVAAFRLNNAASNQNGVQWTGTDQNGMPVPTGLYIIKVNDGRRTFTTKVLKQ